MAFFSGHISFFHFILGLLFPFSIRTLISLFYLDFYFPFLLRLLFPFFLWTYGFPFLFELLFPFSLWTFISPLFLYGLLFNQGHILISSNFLFFLELWPLNQKLIKYGKHFFIATSHCTVSVCHSDLAIFAGFYLYDFKLVFLHQ